jgi:hypothetical protein
VVNTNPIITGKHNPTMSGKHRPAIDKGYFRLIRWLIIYCVDELVDTSPIRTTMFVSQR